MHQDSGLVPGQYPAEDAYPQLGRRSVATSQQSGLSSEGSSQPSLSHQDRYDENSRYGNRTGRGIPSKLSRDRGGRSKPNEDRRAQQRDDIDSKSWPSLRAGLKKVSNFLEPELPEANYADEQDGRPQVHVVSMQEQIHRLSALNNDQAKTIADLWSKLQTESANSQSIKESANKLAFAMENKDLFVGRQDSDDVVISRFGILVGQVKTWSVPFAAQERTGMRINLSGAKPEDVRRVAPGKLDLDRFLQTPKNARLFARGWVGLAMSEMLFRTLPSGQLQGSQGKDIWVDQEIARSFSLIEDRLFHADRNAITLRELHDWRALTAGLVSKFDASSKTGRGMEGYVSECSRQIMDLIGPWVGLDKRQKLEEELLGILLQAVKLSQILRCQRASWSVRHVIGANSQDPGLTAPDMPTFFDEVVMDDKHGDDDSEDDSSTPRGQKIVEIVVSPGLFKRGNTDGERFEFESCVEQAEVRCYSQPARVRK